MSTLLELSWRGALMVVAVASLDRLFSAKINARVRRVWWLLVPVAFLLTVPLPVLPASKFIAPRSVQSLGTIALSVDAAAHPAAPVAVAPPLIHAAGALVIALTGSAIYLLVVLARTYAALRRWSRLPLCTDPTLLRTLEDCTAQAGVITPVGLVVSERISAPLILGWLRPRILLPSTLATSLSREQLRGVLFHELAHVRSLDVPCTFLFTLVCALHWFNPAAHFALRAWTQFREEAADEAAITWLGSSFNLEYGETLLQVLHATNGPRQTSLAVLAVVESVGQLKKRLLMIKQYSSKSSHHALAAIVFVVAAGVLLHPVRAAVPADAPATAASPSEANAVEVKPPTPVNSLAMQVAGTTVAILPMGIQSGGIDIEGNSLTVALGDKRETKYQGNVKVKEGSGGYPGTMTYKGEVKVHVPVPGQPPVTITGNDLVFVRQDLTSPEVVKMMGRPGPVPSTGQLDASGNPILPPPASYALQFGGVTVAVVPAGAPSTMKIDATTGATFASKTRIATFSGNVTITFTVPGQAPVTMTGGDLTLIPEW